MDQKSASEPYRVLARKYRPETFSELIGQDALVRTLRNAFETDRIAHAFVLTGVRGVGKTTTARILAKGLNCIGPDGAGGQTVDPCGVCENCRAISMGRHVDVLEMDAASRTGVGDIREITDSVAFRAASARFKVYIIDEVHMLSTSAFNALLKTLEEPPEHVKFIFATTEIRKVPVTVLSRCQRFDLRRIETGEMMIFLDRIAQQEGCDASQEALALLARAGDGSVRDSLSLLDQAIAHGAGHVDAATVAAMLGLSDRGRIFDLFELVMAGDARSALAELASQYRDGVDPLAILKDLAEVTHWISMIRIAPESANDPSIGPSERDRGLELSKRLEMRVLTRTWQMLLKILDEVSRAPDPMMAAEMAVIRLTHVADLPTPGDLVRRLTESGPKLTESSAKSEMKPSSDARGRSATGPTKGVAPDSSRSSPAVQQIHVERFAQAKVSEQAVATETIATQENSVAVRFPTFEDVVALIRARRDVSLLVDVETGVRLVSYAPGRIEFEPSEDAAPDLAARLAQKLKLWTGIRWGVSVVSTGGGKTISEVTTARRGDLFARASAHPLVMAALSAFPEAAIKDVRAPSLSDPSSEYGADGTLAVESLDADTDDWDPFDPFSEEK
ncbi:MAG: DNA polymerase III subunit gamma/tau [Pseudomonadota bacterium]